MSRISVFSAPFLLGFDAFEARVASMAKASDGYPPYNIERLSLTKSAEHYQITIAVAGFSSDELEIISEDNQLVVRGRHSGDDEHQFLHRGIAMRQFQRSFLLAEGMKVEGADLRDGMLIIGVEQPKIEKVSRRIDIRTQQTSAQKNSVKTAKEGVVKNAQ